MFLPEARETPLWACVSLAIGRATWSLALSSVTRTRCGRPTERLPEAETTEPLAGAGRAEADGPHDSRSAATPTPWLDVLSLPRPSSTEVQVAVAVAPTTPTVDASVAAEAWWQQERREPSIIVRVSARTREIAEPRRGALTNPPPPLERESDVTEHRSEGGASSGDGDGE